MDSVKSFATSVPCFSCNRLITNTIMKTAQLLQILFLPIADKGCRQPFYNDSLHPSKYFSNISISKIARILDNRFNLYNANQLSRTKCLIKQLFCVIFIG